MKSLITTLILLVSASLSFAQGNLQFSYTVNTSGATTTIMVYVENVLAGTENMTSYTMNVYYDDTESTITNYDVTPTNGLGWFSLPSSTPFNARTNAAIPITHTGFGNVNVLDFFGNGSSFGSTATHILTITADNSIGTVAASSFYLSSSSQNHSEQVYNDNGTPIPNAFPVVINQNSNLPVEWLSFEAEPMEGHRSLLKWVTGSEQNNSGFEVERALATDLVPEWESIGFVDGEGTKDSPTEYAFVDPVPFSGENLYRLRQVDLNGEYDYSEVRSVWFEEDFTLSLYPNPTQDILNVRFMGIDQNQEDASFILFDSRGRELQAGNLNPFSISQVNLSGLPEGGYLIRIVLSGRAIVKRIAKVN